MLIVKLCPRTSGDLDVHIIQERAKKLALSFFIFFQVSLGGVDMDIEFNYFLDLYELHYGGGPDKRIIIRKIERTKTNGYRLNQTYDKNVHFVDIELDERTKKARLYYDNKIFHEEQLSDSRYEKICSDLLNVFVYMNITNGSKEEKVKRNKKESKSKKSSNKINIKCYYSSGKFCVIIDECVFKMVSDDHTLDEEWTNLHIFNVQKVSFVAPDQLIIANSKMDVYICLLEDFEVAIDVIDGNDLTVANVHLTESEFNRFVKELKDVEYSFKKFNEGSNMDDEESCDCDTNTLEMPPAGLPSRNLNIPTPEYLKKIFDESKKYDKGKRRFDLVDLSTVGAIADVLGFGAQKYGENTWQNLPDGEKRYFAALLRHLEAHQKGDLIDAESGLPHIYHVFTNAYFLTYLYNRGENRE